MCCHPTGEFPPMRCHVNGQNVFDLSLYVSLHALSLLEGKTCVTPFPNASRVPPFEEDGEPFLHALVCHEPVLTAYNFSLGPAPATAGRRLGAASADDADFSDATDSASDDAALGAEGGGSATPTPAIDEPAAATSSVPLPAARAISPLRYSISRKADASSRFALPTAPPPGPPSADVGGVVHLPLSAISGGAHAVQLLALGPLQATQLEWHIRHSPLATSA